MNTILMNIEIISAIIGAVITGVVGIITAVVSQRLKAKRTKKEYISSLLSEVNINQKKLQAIIKFFPESKKMLKANISPVKKNNLSVFDLFPEKLHFDKTIYFALADKIGLLDSKTKENLLNYYEDLSVLRKIVEMETSFS